MDIMGIIIGMPLGVIASLIAWWILTHGLVPKIKYGPFISKVKVNGKEINNMSVGNYKHLIIL